MRHKAGQLDSLKNLDIHELEAERLETKRKIAHLTEQYLQEKEMQSAGTAKMLRRKLQHSQIVEEKSAFSAIDGGRERGDVEHSDQSEDEEARPIRARKSKSIRFDDEDENDVEDKDTPPTRSRSRKTRARVAFDEPSAKGIGSGANLKSALRDRDDNSKSVPAFKINMSEKSRGSSKSRGRS